ncbi:hypothetical protein CBLAS_1298 [Campylobacter blaseri]|uniref:Uncharacterized protein n=1 Tax=Campylobacter blaseri TaxID=2042961 RepID=A0A2P8QZ47_9BACT|nr:hypothetical protein [Campylobacter blaseri]PSM51519.1 hypothetical protein CQ405_08115 [Campylobacter blaseri]PSM52968.1 hypothetical protein CRN67_08120 [Campylobacter blaseri]QKF86465.1 hypothetical protein CBLAS_1298 [Campylobacter blaseri]
MDIVLKGIDLTTLALFIKDVAKFLIESKNFTGSIYAFLKKDNNWATLINSGLRASYNTIFISAYDKNALYRAVVDKVNVNWKSQMGLLLAGFIDELR